jgi:hypothetical protein
MTTLALSYLRRLAGAPRLPLVFSCGLFPACVASGRDTEEFAALSTEQWIDLGRQSCQTASLPHTPSPGSPRSVSKLFLTAEYLALLNPIARNDKLLWLSKPLRLHWQDIVTTADALNCQAATLRTSASRGQESF